MIRKSLLLSFTLAAVGAWAQAPAAPAAGQAQQPSANAQQPAAAPSAAQGQPAQTANGTSGNMPQTGAPAAASSASNISGCLQRGFANFQVSDQTTNTKYQIRGNGANLASYENHVVQIKGVPDPSASKNGQVVFYADKVQDSGQSCAPGGQAVAGNTPATGSTGNQGVVANETTANAGSQTPEQGQANAAGAVSANSNQATTAGAPATPNNAGQTPAEASTNATAARQAEVGAANGTTGVDNKVPANTQGTSAQVAGQASGQEAGGMENKGTPQAGTPANAGAASVAAKTLQGCLSSDGSSLSSNGKTYTLQGNKAEAGKLGGHQVEVSGPESMGVVDVKSVRDIGSTCSAK